MRAPARPQVSGCQIEAAGHEPLSLRPVHRAVSEPVVGGGAPPVPAAAVDRLDFADHRPGLPPEGARVHRQRTAHRAGDAGEELAPGQPVACREPGDARAGGAGLDAEALRPDRLHRAQPGGGDDRAAHPAVAHQQVAAEPDPQQRLAGGEAREKRRELANAPAGSKYRSARPPIPHAVCRARGSRRRNALSRSVSAGGVMPPPPGSAAPRTTPAWRGSGKAGRAGPSSPMPSWGRPRRVRRRDDTIDPCRLHRQPYRLRPVARHQGAADPRRRGADVAGAEGEDHVAGPHQVEGERFDVRNLPGEYRDRTFPGPGSRGTAPGRRPWRAAPRRPRTPPGRRARRGRSAPPRNRP